MKPFRTNSPVILLGIAMGFVLAASASSVGAEGRPPLSLTEAIDIALRFNPNIQAARHQVEAAVAQTTQARSGLLPQVDLSESYSKTNSPLWAFGTKLNQGVITTEDFSPDRLNDPNAIDNFKTALTLTWPLFDGGKSWIGWHQAERNQEAGRLALLRNEQMVIAQTASTYAACLLAVENRNVVNQALETAHAHLKVVEDRQRSGLAVKSDELRAQVRIADLEQQQLQAESHMQVALAMLGAAMGRPEAVPGADGLETALSDAIPPQIDLNGLVTQALAHRPDLKQLYIQEEIAQAEVHRAKAGHYPSLALQGNYEINTEQFEETQDNYSVGAVVQLNLFSGQRISGQSAEAKALLSRIRAMREAMALGVRVDAQQAFHQAQSAWQSIEVARRAVAQSEEGLRMVADRYENGLLTLVSLLDAQVAHQQAQTQHLKALHDYMMARISLALASGEIDKNFH